MKQFLHKIATDQLNGIGALIIKALFWALSLVYYAVTVSRNIFYKIGLFKVYRLPSSVISIGNLTVGGTGKTPFVEYLAGVLGNKSVKAAILTRGYMGGKANAKKEKSDEAVMLKNALSDVPVLVGADRVKTAQEFLEGNNADVFILDDGFQHRRLSRDLDIAVIDATNPWGNGCLLPRGILRESKSALKRANVFVLTRTDLGADNLETIMNVLKSKNPQAPVIKTIHKPVLLLDARTGSMADLNVIGGKQVCVVSSIGNSDSFDQTLIGSRVNIVKHFAFMDHHIYSKNDIDTIVKFCAEHEIKVIVTTEKDSVKLKSFADRIPEEIELLSLKIRIEITEGEDQILERIDRIL